MQSRRVNEFPMSGQSVLLHYYLSMGIKVGHDLVFSVVLNLEVATK